MSWPIILLGLIAAIPSGCLGAEYGWQPQKEYWFSVQGQDMAGLPQLRQQYAGFRYEGELRVQSHSPRVLLLKLLNFNYTNFHTDLPAGWWNEPEFFYFLNRTRRLPVTTSTVVVKLTKSLSPELVIQSGLSDWEVNFIKGLVSNILSYIGDSFSSSPNSNKYSHTNTKDVFSVIEDSVVGRCEVLYEVSPWPNQLVQNNKEFCNDNQLWEITKTRNYSNCYTLSEDHAHLPVKACRPVGSSCGSFWTRASVTQMVGCGDKSSIVLLSSVTSSARSAQLHLRTNSQAVVNSNLNITLITALDLKRKFNLPQNKQTLSSLLYTYSPTPPQDFNSRSCQDYESHSGKENPGKKSTYFINNEIESTNKNNPDNVQRATGNSKPRNKRGTKKKYRTVYNTEPSEHSHSENRENSNEYFSQQSPSYDEHPDGFKGGKAGKKHTFSEESYEQSSEQPSEEMQLEDQWKLSAKDLKGSPPHQPFNMFNLAHRMSYDLSCLKPKLRQMVADIASDLKVISILPEKNTMDKLSLAVDVCRVLPLDQLVAISEEVFEAHSTTNIMKNTERKVFRDVITMCGTHPALHLIMGWMNRQQVESEEAAEIIASLPSHAISPSKYFVQDFFGMVQDISEKDEGQLSISAVLALSNLVRDACVNEASRRQHFSSILKPVCDQTTVAVITEWLANQIDRASPNVRVYIEALGNIGSSDVIPLLTNIARRSKYSSYLQTSAVFAMRYQALRKQPEMASLLMSLYHSYSLPVSTRIAAAALLVYSDPGLAIWQRLAVSTWYDPSPAVAQFVASTIQNTASTKDTLYPQMSKSASLVLPLTRPTKVSIHQPFNLLTSHFSSDLETLILEQLSWMQFYDLTSFYYRRSSRSSGFSRTNEASFAVTNSDDLWSALKDLIISTDDQYIGEPVAKDIVHTLGEIKESLGLGSRSQSIPKVQAELHLKINNMMERMLVFDKDTLKKWAKGGRKLLSQGNSLSYQKMDMNDFHISSTTELGFPIEFRLRTPWVVSFEADINATNEGIAAEASCMYLSQLLSSVSVMSVWDNTAHSAGAYATNFVQIPPFRLKASLDNQLKVVKLTTDFIQQQRIFSFSMQPFTSQHKLMVHQAMLLSPDTMKIKLGEPNQKPMSLFTQYMNTVYTIELDDHFSFMNFIQGARNIVGFLMLAPDMEPRSIDTSMGQLYPLNLNITMSMGSKSEGLLELDTYGDTILGQLFNSFAKIKPKSSTNLHEANATNTVNSTSTKQQHQLLKLPDLIKSVFKGSNATESNAKNKTMPSSSEDNVLTDTAGLDGGYQVYPTTYESAAGNFNASQINPFDNMVNGSNHAYLIEEVLSKIQSGKAVVIGFNLWSNNPQEPTKISAFVTYAKTYSDRVSRFGLFLKKYGSRMGLTTIHEVPVDIVTDLKTRVLQDLRHNIYMDYTFVHYGQTEKASVKASLGASRAELARVGVSSQLEACSQQGYQYFDSAVDPECQELYARTKEIGFGNITVYYNEEAKFIEKTVEMYLNAAKVVLPWTEMKAGECHNTMTMVFDVNKRTNSVNTVITTPATRISVNRYPLSKLPMPHVVEWAMQDNGPKEFCGVSQQRIRTFDGTEFQYKMKTNWHLVTQDCSGKYGIAVLAQPTNNNSMAIEVNIDDHYVISLEEGPKIYVNGKVQPLNTTQPLLLLTNKRGEVLVHTVFTPDSSVHIQLLSHNLDLVYSNTSLVVQAKQAMQGRLCGLCGSYSKMGTEQLLMANGFPASSPTDFALSYQIKSKQKATTTHENIL